MKFTPAAATCDQQLARTGLGRPRGTAAAARRSRRARSPPGRRWSASGHALHGSRTTAGRRGHCSTVGGCRASQAAIPSPTVSVIQLGPLPVHLYALCIVAGILVALWLTDRRWRARGGRPNQVGDVAGWAVVFGIVGGRLYHVITDPELYFDQGQAPARRPQDLGRRPGHLGRGRARRAGRLDRLPPAQDELRRLRRRRRARHRDRPGAGPVGQLVQQRAVRPGHHAAVEAADPRPGRGHRQGRPRRRRACRGARLLPADLPVRDAVEPAGRGAAAGLDRRRRLAPRPGLRAAT